MTAPMPSSSGPVPSAGSAPFDATALTSPVDRAALTAYLREATANGTARKGPVLTIVIVGVVLAFVLVTSASVLGAVLTQAIGALSVVVTPALIVLVIVAAAAGTWWWWRSMRIHEYRLAMFARANGMSYLPELGDPPLPGMIFDLGHGRTATDLVRGSSPRFVEFANYRYTTGSGKNAQTHEWGYIAIRLDVPLPNIVLDAAANNGLFGSNLPARYADHQRLSLEGDFDRHFALYCPQGYERDALYLFTPDIMARFIDRAATFDVEIVDDWLFLYAQKQNVSTLNPATWARTFGTVGALLDKLAQWARWRDERLSAASSHPGGPPTGPATGIPAATAFAGTIAAPTPAAPGEFWQPPPGVAAPGRRLRRAFPWVSVVAVAGFAVVWIVTQVFRLQ